MTEEEAKKLDELHRFFMEPRAPGKRARCEELDDVLDGVRTGKLGGRVLLWICGTIVTLYATFNAWNGFYK